MQNRKQTYLKIAKIRIFENIQSIKEDIEKKIFLILDVSLLEQKDEEWCRELIEELLNFTKKNNLAISRLGERALLISTPDIVSWEPSYELPTSKNQSLSQYPDFQNLPTPKSLGVNQTMYKAYTISDYQDIPDMITKAIQKRMILILNFTSQSLSQSDFSIVLKNLRTLAKGFVVKELEMFEDDIVIIIPPNIKLWKSDDGISPYSVKPYVVTSEKPDLESPLAILKTRLAKGEITIDEYNEIKSALNS